MVKDHVIGILDKYVHTVYTTERGASGHADVKELGKSFLQSLAAK